MAKKVTITPALSDTAWFADHPDRKFRIRVPSPVSEFETEFRSLGGHQKSRRRVIIARAFGPVARMHGVSLMPIPFLAFADETIEDRDDILLPIFMEIMGQAAMSYGIGR